MYAPPTITALAEERRRDLIARAETHRNARAARTSRPATAWRMRITPRLIAAARRPVTRLLPVKAPATAGAGSES